MLPENFATKPNKTEPKTHFITATRHEKMQPKNQTKINNTSNKSPSTTILTKTNNYKPNNNNNNNNNTISLKRICACVK